jgi:hypothetical protein
MKVYTITIGLGNILLKDIAPMRNPLLKDIATTVVTNKYLFEILSLHIQIDGTVVQS